MADKTEKTGKKTGKWIKFEYGESWDWMCSECGSMQDFRTRFCECCRTEMDTGMEIHAGARAETADSFPLKTPDKKENDH